MKKIFQIIGLISLTCFSFFITEKTALVVNNMDEIMVQIKDKKDQYKSDPVDAIIDNNTIIPGINGREVNVNKSYKNMRSNGYFNENLFVYDYTKPKISILDNMDKYIVKGNPSKRMVSLIFILTGEDSVDDILKIINNYSINVTFFVDYTWFNNNINKIKDMINEGHIIAPYMDDYNDSNFELMDMILRKINKQNIDFCYNVNSNQSNLDICKLKGSYTIKPTVISDKTPLVDIKKRLESGSLLVLSNNSQMKKELSTIIIYIKSKGYKLVSLEENILE